MARRNTRNDHCVDDELSLVFNKSKIMASVAKRTVNIVVGLSGVAVFLYACGSLWHIITSSAPDFGVYYASVSQLISGHDVYRNTHMFTSFVGPPTLLLFFFLQWSCHLVSLKLYGSCILS